MLKLYRFSDTKKEYWETWANEDDTHTVHWGELGLRGTTKIIKSSLSRKAEVVIQKEIDDLISQGFMPIDLDAHSTLLIEYAIEGMGSEVDIDKRHRLEARMNETLGWTGLGYCDGGSIGSGSMEICNFVVDLDVAISVIKNDLVGTEFANYTRIFDENTGLSG